MVEGRGKEAWDRTAALLACLINIHRNPKKTPAVKPMELNPYRLLQQRVKREKAPITILRDVFIDGKRWERN